jgi:hypothetical protein
MSNKKNLVLLTIMAHFSFTSYATQFGPQVRDAKKNYQSLLQFQGINNPLDNSAFAQISRVAARQDFQKIFTAAERTGLVFQIEELLTKPSIIQMNDFISPEHIQVIAYMQNKYGNGNPFVYNGQANNNDLGQTAVLGTYRNPSGQIITITRYSFFNTLLEALYKISYDQSSNPYFLKMYDIINNNIATALQASKHPAQDPRQKLAELLKKVQEYGQRSIDLNVSTPIDIMIKGLEETMKKATFGRGY